MKKLALLVLLFSCFYGCDGGSDESGDEDGGSKEDGGEKEDAATDDDDDNDSEDDDDNDDEPKLPELKSIDASKAKELAAYTRRLTTQAENSVATPAAWAMVNISCQERALAAQYALAAAGSDLQNESPFMKSEELTAENIMKLVENPAYDSGIISITGPLVTKQRLITPEGKEVEGEPLKWYWAYHHAAVLNVEGELKVIDLSVGDDPIAIDDWAANFVAEPVKCYLMGGVEYQKVWSYWISVSSSWDPGERPERPCGYTITPIFRFRWDQEPLVDVVISIPFTMETQTGSFKTFLKTDYNLTPADEELPYFTSVYTAQTEKELCSWVDLKYCKDVE